VHLTGSNFQPNKNMTINKERLKAGLKALQAVAEAIRELKQIPSGTLYAQLMGVMDLETYEHLIGTLKGAGLVSESQAHLLTWIEPKHAQEPAPCTCGHSHEDHRSDEGITACWNGSGTGNLCDCQHYEPTNLEAGGNVPA
jgi:hypothetical protein